MSKKTGILQEMDCNQKLQIPDLYMSQIDKIQTDLALAVFPVTESCKFY